ncbi:MAG: family acetyltransferase [Tardiphaga sp.]|nr:family acetyltransferase [Tardiphaga sp.]
MLHLDPGKLGEHTDALLTRGGAVVTLRFAGVADADALQAYFRNLSMGARYNRLMGAASELPAGQLDAFTHVRDDGRFSVVATMTIDGVDRIVGEARYAFDEDTARFEFGLSVGDRWQGQGLGMALMSNLQCRAAALDAETLFGDTLRSNDAMLALARKAGFSLAATPNDWKQVRFEKRIGHAQPTVGCASWRLRAEAAVQVAV